MLSNKLDGLLKKEMITIAREPASWMPMAILPLIFSIVFPIIIFLAGAQESIGNIIAGAQGFLERGLVPSSGSFGDPSIDATWGLLNYFFAPLFLLFPVVFSTLLASYSFVGEKLEGTMEGLLSTPLTVRSIAFTKMISALLPSTIASWVSIAVYIGLVNILGYPKFGRLVLFNTQWALIFLLVPLIAFFSIGLVVLVSQRSKSIKSAQSVAIVGIVPVVATMLSQAAGSFLLGSEILIAIVAIVFLADILVTWLVGTITTEQLILR